MKISERLIIAKEKSLNFPSMEHEIELEEIMRDVDKLEEYYTRAAEWVSVDKKPKQNYGGMSKTVLVAEKNGNIEFGYFDFGKVKWYAEKSKRSIEAVYWLDNLPPLPEVGE